MLETVAHRATLVGGGEIIEQNPPEAFFTRPESERTRLFLRRVNCPLIRTLAWAGIRRISYRNRCGGIRLWERQAPAWRNPTLAEPRQAGAWRSRKTVSSPWPSQENLQEEKPRSELAPENSSTLSDCGQPFDLKRLINFTDFKLILEKSIPCVLI
ncbi:MAG: hypothetical protein WAV07_02045 [Candidatus Contendobacter sp.]